MGAVRGTGVILHAPSVRRLVSEADESDSMTAADFGSGGPTRGDSPDAKQGNGSGPGPALSEEIFRVRREKMVDIQLRARGVSNHRILDAMLRVPRHLFIPEREREAAYHDGPVPLSGGQTISQPYIVAVMTDFIHPEPDDRVLEVGTGSGYQTAILAELVSEVYTIEIAPTLGRQAAQLLQDLGYKNVHARIGDGHRGWPEAAPFDAIVVTAAPERIPSALEAQLAIGGRLIIPVGAHSQDLILVTRTSEGLKRETVAPVRFVPMTGETESDR